MEYTVVQGDIAEQTDVDAIVNSWNRNLFPWWLLLPQGVSKAIKKKAGIGPFNELMKFGILKLGDAVLTGPGKLPIKGIIHVAGINFLWRGTLYSIQRSVEKAVKLAEQSNFKSIAMPLIGSGSGGYKPDKAKDIICQTLDQLQSPVSVRLVIYK